MSRRADGGDEHVAALEYGHRKLAIDLLTRAFLDDPLMSYVMDGRKTAAQRIQGINALMDYSLAIREAYNWPILGIWSEKSLKGIAVLSLPEKLAQSPQVDQKYQVVKQVLGEEGSRLLETYGKFVESQRPKAVHIYLGILGVDPDAQGRGYGKRLLDAVQLYSENYPDSTGVFLDTENPRNVPFYEQSGYAVQSEHVHGKVNIWCMFRANRVGRNE